MIGFLENELSHHNPAVFALRCYCRDAWQGVTAQPPLRSQNCHIANTPDLSAPLKNYKCFPSPLTAQPVNLLIQRFPLPWEKLIFLSLGPGTKCPFSLDSTTSLQLHTKAPMVGLCLSFSNHCPINPVGEDVLKNSLALKRRLWASALCPYTVWN